MEEDRQLIIRLLQEDIMAYQYFIKDIRRMSEEELENFLEGNKYYSFNISRKNMFNSLLAKMENYKFIFFWGHNNAYYPYLKELWKNYICIEDLKQIKNDDEKLRNFLESNNIHYSFWPVSVKNDFKNCLEQTENTIVYTCKKMYQSLRGATKYILNKFKDFITYLDQMGLTNLKSLLVKVHMDMIKKVLLGGSGIGISTYKIISSQILQTTAESICSTTTFEMIKNNAKELFISNKFLLGESIITVGNLIIAIKNFYDIHSLASKIVEYKSRLNIRYQSFQRHISEIDYDRRLTSTEDLQKVFENILQKVHDDLKDLEDLIKQINDGIADCENKKISSGIGIAGSALLTVGGIGMAIATCGTSLVATGIHIGNSAGNAISGAIHIHNLVKSCEIAKKLKKVLNEANKKRNDIKKVINDLNIIIYKLSKEYDNIPLPKYLNYI
jgi:hypothetical protein